MTGRERLAQIAEQLESGNEPETRTTRTVLEWFGAQRRGHHVVRRIRGALRAVGLETEPDFEAAYIDAALTFRKADGARDEGLLKSRTATADATLANDPELVTSGIPDPTFRIGMLASANRAPIWVAPQRPLQEALTLMMVHDFSQIPVMIGEREVKGAVTWKSIAVRKALGRPCASVDDCLERTFDVRDDVSIFAAIPLIVEHQYVLVRDPTKRVCGIVTTTDLSLQFRQRGEPFLLLGEIENHLRRLSDGKFTQPQLAEARDPDDGEREVTSAADLTFGEHIRLLENPARWQALGLDLDRNTLVQQLQQVREIRNNVMHFHPDGIEPSELETLRNLVRFLEDMSTIGVVH